MPNAATIQAKISKGEGKAGTILGQPFTWFRPRGPASPVRPACNMGATVSADLNTGATGKSRAANLYGKATWYPIYDRTRVQVGDYMRGQSGTFFVAAQQPLLASVWVDCNRVVTLNRAAAVPSGPAGAGFTAYAGNGGPQRSNDPAYLTGWPASVLQGTKGEQSPAGLPDDVRAPWVAVLLPVLPPGLTIQTTDQFTDDLDRTYTVSSAELTDLGWRLTAAYAGT